MVDTNLLRGLAPDRTKNRKSADRFDDHFVRELQPPAAGNRVHYDRRGKEPVRGFGVRVTAAGSKSFVLNYTIAGRERRLTIGGYPAWSVAAAREHAKSLRRRIDSGEDPLATKEADRTAATVLVLCDRYLADHASRKRTGKQDRAYIERLIRPRLGSRKVQSITFSDLDGLHRKLTAANGPYLANRVAALLSKMFALAIRWGMRPDNPAKGIDRNQEEKRYRYLTGDELRRLTEALTAYPNQIAASAVRLLLLTGARRGEVLGATWDQFDLERGIWCKPSSHTKQKREHRVQCRHRRSSCWQTCEPRLSAMPGPAASSHPRSCFLVAARMVPWSRSGRPGRASVGPRNSTAYAFTTCGTPTPACSQARAYRCP